MMLKCDPSDSFVYQYLTLMTNFFYTVLIPLLQLNQFTLKYAAIMSAILNFDIILWHSCDVLRNRVLITIPKAFKQ